MKNDIPIFAIDFEGSKALGIVEYGIVEVVNSQIARTFSAICRPRKNIPQNDSKFFDISNDEALNCAPFESACELFSSLRQSGIFAAHNRSTEDTLLRSHIPSPGRVRNFLIASDTLEWAPWLDSRDFAKYLAPDIASEKLSDAIASLKLTEELNALAKTVCAPRRATWHRALFDALASALIIKKALQQMQSFDEILNIANVKNRGELGLF